MKITINGVERTVDKYLHKNLMLYKKAVARKWDGVFFVGGYEGDGKSVFAAQVASIFDHTYCLERCVFTPQQFIDAVNKAEKGQAIVYDEAQDAFESTNRDKMTKAVKSMLTRIRRKQLYLIIVAPDFWRINKYLFIHRSRAFFRVYAVALERGRFEFYNRERKHELLIKGKREEKLCVPPNFRAKFMNWFPLDEEAYNKKKEAADVGKVQLEERKKTDQQLRIEAAVKVFKWVKRQVKGLPLTMSDLASFMGCDRKTLYNNDSTNKKPTLEASGGGFEGNEEGTLTNNNFPPLPRMKGLPNE